jgi:uncharacterized DUF497 family protein
MPEGDVSELHFEFEEFEWDEAKAKRNLKNHGIDFEDAAGIFREAVVARPQIEEGEDRWIAIGQVAGRELVVVFTERENRCRIISARVATRRERRECYAILGR